MIPAPDTLKINGQDRLTGFYFPELDGLRFFAVSSVFIAHFSPTLGKYGDWGNIGVRLFFVLSGFLITAILLRTRLTIEAGATTRLPALRTFFVRRIFRLWPLYFLCLFLAYAWGVQGTESSLWWHVSFTTNHYIFLHQHWPDLLSHLWSLSVEQQFYIIWPLIVLLVPITWFPWINFALIVAGPLSRALLLATGTTEPAFTMVLLPSCLDFFAIGGLVAWNLQRGSHAQLKRPLLVLLITVLAVWIILGSILKSNQVQPASWVVYDASIQAIGFGALIQYLVFNPQNPLTPVLRLRGFVYLGQISYGLYIYHNFMHRLGPTLLRRLTGHNYFSNEAVHVIYLSSLSILTAVCSYHFFEQPLRRLGRRLA